MSTLPLTHKQVYRSASLDENTCKSTKYITPIDEIVGQDRAQQAVEFAMSIPDRGYNIYAVGQNGLGKRTMVLRYLKRHNPAGNGVYDWCYVTNFDDTRTPKVLKLPIGTGLSFKKEIEKITLKLVKAIPLAFDNELYYTRTGTLKNQLVDKQESLLGTLTKEAKSKGISLAVTTQGDYQFIAMNGEELHTEETFDALDRQEQRQLESIIDELEIKLRSLVRQLTEWEDKYSDKIEKLNEDVVSQVLTVNFEAIKSKYNESKIIAQHLKEMEKDILENFDVFLQEGKEDAELAYASLEKKLPRRYQINLLVSQKDEQFPLIVEESPSYHNLFGYIENATFKGTVFTDYSLIRAGSLHKANGGVLLMDAVKVLERPYVWDGLKRALRSQNLNLSSLEKEVTLSGTVSLEPEPIPLNVKIILFGDYQTYQLLQHYDSEFSELFKVTADFEDDMPRTEASEFHYAQFISSIVHDGKMLQCDKKAIERIIEYSSRQAGDQNRLSLHSADISNLLKETNYIAKTANSNMIRLKHVEQALANKEHRVNRVQYGVMQSFINGTTLMETNGGVVGQVNALSVLSTSNHQFGMPNRITATTSFGKGEVFDIERKVELGGSIHSKGVFILSAYLSSLFGNEKRIPLKTCLAFEQSYGGVDGDSASMAEFCSIISAFSEKPIRQDIAITGSMNQFGEAQPIGGVNEKIEGFYQVCKIKGLQPNQGVIIPQSNIQNLMLNSEVTQAIEKGTFTIWAVKHVSESIELLMGSPIELESGEGIYNVIRSKLTS
ncbi:ATP-binding protein [Aliivibrio finisterrensis]|uniref:endopeptidase La n=1 Tax=Aliivibrio finisterrensis TaxID=511998 RepID=A0A4Q5KBB1_9GAMM|nr:MULTISPECIES: ATP-binding protein [Aliivibrio]MDD9176511.1 ATP-binding protein [Aliivibrio sp. S3TY1]MDD9193589.1 ATP-binding protein [Aliivibrio sp. S2TY2]RYU42102.1 ATP-binding protein [Aliivibrio finisterrensis]